MDPERQRLTENDFELQENAAYHSEEQSNEDENHNPRLQYWNNDVGGRKDVSNTPKWECNNNKRNSPCKQLTAEADSAISNPTHGGNNNSQSQPFKEVDVDEFLIHIGQFGRAQKLLLLMFYLLEVPHSYHTLSWFFTGHSPPWKCSLKNNITRAQCNSTAVYDIGDPFYEQRCFMARNAWDYIQPRSYSIVTEVCT